MRKWLPANSSLILTSEGTFSNSVRDLLWPATSPPCCHLFPLTQESSALPLFLFAVALQLLEVTSPPQVLSIFFSPGTWQTLLRSGETMSSFFRFQDSLLGEREFEICLPLLSQTLMKFTNTSCFSVPVRGEKKMLFNFYPRVPGSMNLCSLWIFCSSSPSPRSTYKCVLFHFTEKACDTGWITSLMNLEESCPCCGSYSWLILRGLQLVRSHLKKKSQQAVDSELPRTSLFVRALLYNIVRV